MKKLTRILAASLAALTVFAIIVFADTGSASDPLITLSYVNQVLLPNIETKNQYSAIQMHAGETLYSESACEVILRAGKATAGSPFENQGLSDVTEAKELYNSDALTINHLLMIPRADGRGIAVTEGEAWFMIRGKYRIESNNS